MLTADRAHAAVPLLITLLACSAPEQPQAEPSEPARLEAPAPPLPKSWSVTITTGGGFFGQGQGGVTVCGSIDLGQDRPAIERAVAEARPQLWTRSYNSADERMSCCDHFSYSVEFRRDEGEQGEVVYKTSWQGGTGYFPPDLKTLFTSVWQLRGRALAACPDR